VWEGRREDDREVAAETAAGQRWSIEQMSEPKIELSRVSTVTRARRGAVRRSAACRLALSFSPGKEGGKLIRVRDAPWCESRE